MNRLSKDIYEIDTLIFSDISDNFNNFGSLIIMGVLCGLCFNIKAIPIAVVYIVFAILVSYYFLKSKR